MVIKIFGTGCKKCGTLEERTRKAVEKIGVEAEIQKIEDVVQIMESGIMRTPAMAINDEIVVTGRVPMVSKLESIISKHINP